MNRKLYTLSQTSSKDSIPYPVFRAKPDEDMHKFLAEFKDALIRNQIPKKDQVKILRMSSLKNFALEVVHKDITDIDEAYKILLKQFGNSDQVFASKLKIFLNECERKWPEISTNPKELYQKMTRLISQLDDLQKLVDDKSVDKGELFNTHNVKRLFSIVPTEITLRVYEKIDENATNEEKVKALKNSLEVHRKTAQQKLAMELDEREKVSVNHLASQRTKKKVSNKQRQCFICQRDWNEQTHIKEWGIFGCPELLVLTSEQRRGELLNRNICFNCGWKRVMQTCQA